MSSDLSASPYERLDMGGADFQPLSPVHFLRRSAYIFRDKIAIAYGARRYSYGEFGARCERLAAALSEWVSRQARGVRDLPKYSRNAGVAFCGTDDWGGVKHDQYPP